MESPAREKAAHVYTNFYKPITVQNALLGKERNVLFIDLSGQDRKTNNGSTFRSLFDFLFQNFSKTDVSKKATLHNRCGIQKRQKQEAHRSHVHERQEQNENEMQSY